GVGLSTGGDAVAVFDASGNQVTGVQFGSAPPAAPFATFDNTAGAGSTTTPLPTITTLSVAGVNGAVRSANGHEVRSPAGVPPTVPPAVITEVSPWASGDSPYAADWFELTNTGSSPLYLDGWKMDDNSNSFGNAVPLAGVAAIPAGKSAVFFEDTGGL